MNYIINFIYTDWKLHGYRFILEIFGIGFNISGGIILVTTTPNPTLGTVFSVFLIGGVLLLSGALARKSIGLTLLYTFYLVIDSYGLYRSTL